MSPEELEHLLQAAGLFSWEGNLKDQLLDRSNFVAQSTDSVTAPESQEEILCFF